MKKKGFTLVELLAVIAILAILVIIALPNVMSMFNNAKKSSFETEVKQIFKLTKSQWMSDNLTSGNEAIYSKCENGCNNPIKSMDARKGLNYYIKVNGTGKITRLYVTDGTFQYEYSGLELKIEEIENASVVSTLEPTEILSISNNQIMKGGKEYVVTENGTPISGLSLNAKLGDYVKMKPKLESYTLDETFISKTYTIDLTKQNIWRVIKKNGDGTLDLVLDKPTATLFIENSDKAYYNYVGFLNKVASKFENDKYTIKSRHLGYNGQTEYLNPEMVKIPSSFFSSNISTYITIDNSQETAGGGDMMYQDDLDLIKNVYGSYDAKAYYFIASRYKDYKQGGYRYWYWNGRYIDYNGELQSGGLIFRCSNSCAIGGGMNGGFRPIITMKANLVTNGGDGSKNNPFTLE